MNLLRSHLTNFLKLYLPKLSLQANFAYSSSFSAQNSSPFKRHSSATTTSYCANFQANPHSPSITAQPFSTLQVVKSNQKSMISQHLLDRILSFLARHLLPYAPTSSSSSGVIAALVLMLYTKFTLKRVVSCVEDSRFSCPSCSRSTSSFYVLGVPVVLSHLSKFHPIPPSHSLAICVLSTT